MKQCEHDWGWTPCDSNGYTSFDVLDGLVLQSELGQLVYELCLLCGKVRKKE